jgi:hypothetical protein
VEGAASYVAQETAKQVCQLFGESDRTRTRPIEDDRVLRDQGCPVIIRFIACIMLFSYRASSPSFFHSSLLIRVDRTISRSLHPLMAQSVCLT